MRAKQNSECVTAQTRRTMQRERRFNKEHSVICHPLPTIWDRRRRRTEVPGEERGCQLALLLSSLPQIVRTRVGYEVSIAGRDVVGGRMSAYRQSTAGDDDSDDGESDERLHHQNCRGEAARLIANKILTSIGLVDVRLFCVVGFSGCGVKIRMTWGLRRCV